MKYTFQASLFALALATSVQAQVINQISVSKRIQYFQSSATKVERNAAKTLPFDFDVEVQGESRSALAALSPEPSIKLPKKSKFTAITNGLVPTLGLASEDTSFRFGYVGKQNFDNWATKTKKELDDLFPSGDYVIKAEGKTITLNLPEDTYASAPVLVLSGGRWVNSVYRIKATNALTVNTGIYTNYGQNLNDYISIDMVDAKTDQEIISYAQVAKKLAHGPSRSSSRFYSKTIAANKLKAGRTYYVDVSFGAIVSQSQVLPDALCIGTYVSNTSLTIVVE